MVHQVQQVLQVRLASQESQVDLKEEMKHLFGSFPGLDGLYCQCPHRASIVEAAKEQTKKGEYIAYNGTLNL
uniref:Uncharacterized protein n=1 Tax=Ditylenchus dipsaci TaxID=166011 RepID=A0A915DH73_9BILA